MFSSLRLSPLFWLQRDNKKDNHNLGVCSVGTESTGVVLWFFCLGPLVKVEPCFTVVSMCLGFSQLPKADLLAFWLFLFGLVLVMAPKG